MEHCEDDFPTNDKCYPNEMPSGGLSAGSCMLLDVRLSGIISDSGLRVLDGNIPHFLGIETDTPPGPFFDFGSSLRFD